jgi:hypothetical protein
VLVQPADATDMLLSLRTTPDDVVLGHPDRRTAMSHLAAIERHRHVARPSLPTAYELASGCERTARMASPGFSVLPKEPPPVASPKGYQCVPSRPPLQRAPASAPDPGCAHERISLTRPTRWDGRPRRIPEKALRAARPRAHRAAPRRGRVGADVRGGPSLPFCVPLISYRHLPQRQDAR